MNNTPEKKKRNGRFPVIVKRKNKVVDLIPDNGASIRFKALKAECKKHNISHRILLKDLDRLQEAGTIIKDAVKLSKGAGTEYKRKIASFAPPPINYPLFEKAMKQADEIDDGNEREKQTLKALHGMHVLIYSALLSEMVEYALNTDKQKAELRLESALSDIIIPLIKEAVQHIPHPVIHNREGVICLFNATKLGHDNWDKVWNLSTSPEGYQKGGD